MEYWNLVSKCVPQTRGEIDELIRNHKWELAAAAITSYAVYRLIQNRKLPPGPYGLPFLGSMLKANGLLDGTLPLKLKEYGDISTIQIGSELQVWLNTSEVVRQAFVTQSHDFSFRPRYNSMELHNFSDDIFSLPYGEEWKKNKRFIISSLKSMGFGSSSYEGKVLAEADALIAHLEKVQVEAEGKGISLGESLKWTAANLIHQIIFSKRFEYDEEFKEVCKLVAHLTNPSDSTLAGLIEFLPLWFSKIALRSGVQKMKNNINELRAYFRKEIDSHVESRTPGEPRDFVDAYLDEYYGPDFNFQRLTDNLMFFLPDAMESLPMALEFLILNIIRTPGCQEKIQKELDEVVGSGRQPSMKDRPHLNYLEAASLESLRSTIMFYLSAAHKIQTNVNLRGYQLPKGAGIYFNHLAVHFDPAKFSDPKEFKPERFIDAAGKFTGCNDVFPFGTGPRACAGQSLAKMEIFLLAAKLFQTFDIQFHKDYDKNSYGLELKGMANHPKEYQIVLKRR